MKIIFTDIDGVLNSAYYIASTGGGISFIEERKVKNLKKIVEATGAVVVVVSRANAFLGKEFDEARLNGIKEYGVMPIDSIRDIEFQAWPTAFRATVYRLSRMPDGVWPSYALRATSSAVIIAWPVR